MGALAEPKRAPIAYSIQRNRLQESHRHLLIQVLVIVPVVRPLLSTRVKSSHDHRAFDRHPQLSTSVA